MMLPAGLKENYGDFFGKPKKRVTLYVQLKSSAISTFYMAALSAKPYLIYMLL
jgi:hypothetical protein